MVHMIQGLTIVLAATNIPQKLPEYLTSECIIKSNKNNSADVWLGGSDVDSVNGKGLPLAPAESSDPLHVPLLSEVFISGTKGDKIHIFVYDNPVLDKLNDLLAHVTGQNSFLG